MNYRHLLFLLFASIGHANAQMFVEGSSDGGITITPKGVIGKKHNILHISNTAFGSGALDSLTNVQISNTAFGDKALKRLNSGSYNIGIGSEALANLKYSRFNTAIGTQAMSNVDDLSESKSEDNVAVGYLALLNGSVLKNNTAVGANALRGKFFSDESNMENTSVGYKTMTEVTTGSFNTAVGAYSLDKIEYGDRNSAIGVRSGMSNNGGINNVFIGYESGYSNTIGHRNVFIGYQSGYHNITGSDFLVIENSNNEAPLIGGNFVANKLGINRTFAELGNRNETFQVSGEAFKTAGTGNWNIPSDRRLKENIVYLNSHQMLDKVLNMKGVSYYWIDKARGADKVFGFIAQDIQEVFPENVKTDKEGFLSASYGAYDPMIIESIKALKDLIDQQREEINALKAKLNLEENQATSNSEKQ